MVVGRQKIGRIISKHLHKKDIREPPTKDSCRAAKEAEHQIAAEVAAEALTHTNLYTACTTVAKPTIAPKIAPFSLSQKEKWNKLLHSLHGNPHPEKSTTPCNGLPTSSNITHPILRLFHHRFIKTVKLNLLHTTNPTITPQPTILNLR
jgi:hypothetical protein